MEAKLTYKGLPHYKIVDDNIYRLKFWRSNLLEEQCISIIQEYKKDKITILFLSKKFSTSKRTIFRIIRTSINDLWVKMKPQIGTNNRYIIQLYDINRNHTQYDLARLICETFHGPCPLGMECCHNDGNSLNNYPNNLRWDTHQENINDKRKHGTLLYGEKCSWSIFNNEQILMIRYLDKFLLQKEIAKMYNTTQQTISRIVNRKIWRYI